MIESFFYFLQNWIKLDIFSFQEIERSEGKHFLILFRDAGCQFRALYSYNPETEEVIKLYGIGPRIITDKMMDRFYK